MKKSNKKIYFPKAGIIFGEIKTEYDDLTFWRKALCFLGIHRYNRYHNVKECKYCGRIKLI